MNMKRKIYVASSWRNEYYTEVVAKLRDAGTLLQVILDSNGAVLARII